VPLKEGKCHEMNAESISLHHIKENTLMAVRGRDRDVVMICYEIVYVVVLT
jgi:hypothetical protein